jgi:hypothetical protein
MKKELIIKIAVLTSVLAMFVINILSNALPINGLTTASISDSLAIYFVPAGYVFSIWGLIYLGIIIYLISMFVNFKKEDMAIAPYVIASSLANTAWIFMWHYKLIYISVIFMLIILASLIMIALKLNKPEVSLAKKIPFSIYLGWISVASIANIAGALFTANWNGFGMSPEVWSAIMIVIATVLAILALIKKNVAYTLVILWALIGIVVKFQGISNIVTITGILTIIIITLFMGYKLFKESTI